MRQQILPRSFVNAEEDSAMLWEPYKKAYLERIHVLRNVGLALANLVVPRILLELHVQNQCWMIASIGCLLSAVSFVFL